MNDVKLIRWGNFQDRTIGRLEYDNKYLYTVELPWLENAVNISCIPEGEYSLVRFRDLYGYSSSTDVRGFDAWAVDVQHPRSHIVIHVANTASQLHGCIGLGKSFMQNGRGVVASAVGIEQFYRDTADWDEARLTIYQGAIVEL